MRRTVFFLFFCLLMLLNSGSVVADEGPVGEEFQVNTYTTDVQEHPSVAIGPSGEFVVVWDSRGSGSSDSSYYSIQGQRYGADGELVGDEFQVNTFTTGRQKRPDVGFESSGDFVVVWDSEGTFGDDSSPYGIQGQRFNSDGTPKGAEFQVNTYTTDFQGEPRVSVSTGGEFVVVWKSYGSGGSDSDGTSINGQRFASDGTKVSSEFQVNTYTTNNQRYPAVATGSDDSFVVVWYNTSGSLGSDSSFGSIQGQRFASDGLVVGDEFQVNSYTTNDQRNPSIAMQPDGEFIIAWQSEESMGSDTLDGSVEARRFDSSGSAIGVDFQVNSLTTGFQGTPSVVSNSNGAFTIAWMSLASPGNDSSVQSIQGRRFTASGDSQGDQFQVNTYTTDTQNFPQVAMASNGDFVVIWESYDSFGTDHMEVILGQRFHPNLFVDGFESGDTTAWSSASP